VRGYPTLAYFRGGSKVEAYKGGRGLDDLKEFVSAQLGAAAGGDTAPKEKEPEAPSAVTKLSPESFKAEVEKGVTFVKFFAPWCGHCKRMAPTWEKLAENYVDNEGVTIAHVDCTDEENKNRALCDGEGVNGFPTLNIYKDGEKVEEYNGKRDLDALVEFVDKHIKGEVKVEVKDEL
jgi:thioredoxin domain-containing protein 5